MDAVSKKKKENKFFSEIKKLFGEIFSNPFKTTLYTGVVLLILVVLYFVYIYFARANFYSAYSDDIYQYYPFMVDFIDSIKTGRFSLFNQTNYLGASFFSDTYYIPLDFFTFTIFLLSFLMPTEIAMSLVELFKLVAGTMALCLYLSYRGTKSKWVHLIGILYFSSSGITCFACFSSFGSLAFYLPFSLVIGYMFLHKRWYYTAPFSALVVLYNYYLAYTVFAFMAFSILFMLILNKEKWYKVIYKTVVYVLFIILGLAMAMFIFLPSVFFILYSTSRNVVDDSSLSTMIHMGATYFEFIPALFKSLFNLLKTIFTNKIGFFTVNNYLLRDSLVDLRYLYHKLLTKRYVDGEVYFASFFDREVIYRLMGSAFVPSSPSSFYGYLESYLLEHASVYITGTGALIASFALYQKDYKSKVYKVMLLMIIIFMSFPLFSYIFSANLSDLYTRWMNVIPIPLLLIASHVLDITDLKGIKTHEFIISCLVLIFFGVLSSMHHMENLTDLAEKNNWSENLIKFEKEALYFLIIILISVIIYFFLMAYLRGKSKKTKTIFYPIISALLIGVIVLLGIKILGTYKIEGNDMFTTEYINRKPYYDTDDLLFNELCTIVTLIVIACNAYFIMFGKKKLFIGFVTFEFLLSACLSFGAPAIFYGEEDVYKKTEKLAEIVNSNIDEKDIYRVYIDKSISGLERENIARFFGLGTNQSIFHSFVNASTDEIVNIIFNISDEGQANKEALNVYSYYLNVFLGYKYIVSETTGSFSGYDEAVFELVYQDNDYIILEFKDYEPFLVYEDYIGLDSYNSIKNHLTDSTRMSYVTEYGIVDVDDKDVVGSFLGAESESAKDYAESSHTKTTGGKENIYKTSTQIIDSKEYNIYTINENLTPTTRSYAINIFGLSQASNIEGEKGMFIEFDNGERYYINNSNVRNMNGSSLHIPIYGENDKSLLINGSNEYTISNNGGSAAKVVSIGYLSKYDKNYLSLSFESIFENGPNMFSYENYTTNSASTLNAFVRYKPQGISINSLLSISSSGKLNTGNIVVEYTDGTREKVPSEISLKKEIKYVYVDKGSLSSNESLPSITIVSIDNQTLYSDNLSNKDVKVKGNKISLSYDNDNLEDSYQIIMLPIAYSEEWELVSGDVKGIIKLNGGFVGFVVSNKLSHNEITIKFVPRGWKTGLIISLVSILIYLGLTSTYIICSRARRKKHAEA